MNGLRVAIIGVGRMGRRHIVAARSMGAEVVGICDTNDEALGLAEQEHGLDSSCHYRDAVKMIERTRPDGVIIATTAPTHADLTCAAAEAGVKGILCEKPMATSLAGCDRMIETCRRHGARLAVNHQMRFMENYTIPRQRIWSEEFGGPSSITVVGGNFGMAMNGTHYFEMFRYITDEPPRWVTAWFAAAPQPNPRGPQFEDRAGAVRVVSASGRRFYMECGSDQGLGLQIIYAAPRGEIFVDELYGEMILTAREEKYRDSPTTQYALPSVRRRESVAATDAIGPSAAVLRALMSGDDYPTGEDGRLTLSVLVAAHLSDERGNVAVDLATEELPRDRTFRWA